MSATNPSTSAAPASSTTTAPTSWWQRLWAALRDLFVGPSTTRAQRSTTKTPLSTEEREAQTTALRRALSAWLEREAVACWRPVTVDDDVASSAEGTVAAGRSWFGGGALVGRADAWPRCRQCQQPMHHFLQLDLTTLPAGAWPNAAPTGLLSLFYCSTDDGNCEVWDPKSGATAFVHSHDSDALSLQMSLLQHALKRKVITAFIEHSDAPAGHRGVDHDGGAVSVDGVVVARDVDYGVFIDVVAPAAGDKLCGTPYEIQGPQPLPCPVCQREMRQLFQIDSNDNLDYMFGDSGCAHIVQCFDHPEQLSFWWDCC